jgi:hypothetical protein
MVVTINLAAALVSGDRGFFSVKELSKISYGYH